MLSDKHEPIHRKVPVAIRSHKTRLESKGVEADVSDLCAVGFVG